MSLERCGYFTRRELTPLEMAFLIYHTGEGERRRREAERLRQKERWAMSLLSQHAPQKAREYLLRDEDGEPEPEGPDEQQFLIEDPWFSDQRALHEILGVPEERLQDLLQTKD